MTTAGILADTSRFVTCLIKIYGMNFTSQQTKKGAAETKLANDTTAPKPIKTAGSTTFASPMQLNLYHRRLQR